MEREVNCLKHCRAICCSKSIYYEIWPSDADFFNEKNTKMEFVREGLSFDHRSLFRRIQPCDHLNGRICTYDPRVTGEEDMRPDVCSNFKVGKRTCLKLRAEYPDGVEELTEADIKFQKCLSEEEDMA